MKRVLVAISFLLVALSISYAKTVKFVDLGLPSGIKWGAYTAKDRLSWSEAIKKYGAHHIPSVENYKELFTYCKLEKNNEYGLLITAPNGNQILIDEPYLWTKTEKKKNIDGVQAVMIEGDSIFFFFDGKKDIMNTHLIK